MKPAIENLYTLQGLVRETRGIVPPGKAEIVQSLRTEVPAPILGHFDRMIARGINGVALVRHGVCTECHIRVPVSTLGALLKPKDLYLCENCGCYLLLPEEETQAAEEIVVPKSHRPHRHPATA